MPYPVEVLEIKVVRLDGTLPLPSTARPGDAGVDLHARDGVVLGPGERTLVPTGIALEIPDGYAGFVLPRSGLATKAGVTCLNAPGLIDASYRGEIGVILVNHDPAATHTVERGDRIAQLVIQKVEEVRWVEVGVGALSTTVRGAGGFGHSGTA